MSLSACCAHSLSLVACLVSFSSTSTLSVVSVVLVCLWFYPPPRPPPHPFTPSTSHRSCVFVRVSVLSMSSSTLKTPALEAWSDAANARSAKKRKKHSQEKCVASAALLDSLGDQKHFRRVQGWVCVCEQAPAAHTAPPKRRLRKVAKSLHPAASPAAIAVERLQIKQPQLKHTRANLYTLTHSDAGSAAAAAAAAQWCLGGT